LPSLSQAEKGEETLPRQNTQFFIGTLACQAEWESFTTWMVTPDKDFQQLSFCPEWSISQSEQPPDFPVSFSFSHLLLLPVA
jgi:hypothetical protein